MTVVLFHPLKLPFATRPKNTSYSQLAQFPRKFFSQFYERTNSIGGLCIEHAELICLITYLSFYLLSHSGPVNPLSQTHLYPAGSGIHVPPLKQRWSLGQTGPLAEGEKIKKIGHFDIYIYIYIAILNRLTASNLEHFCF